MPELIVATLLETAQFKRYGTPHQQNTMFQ